MTTNVNQQVLDALRDITNDLDQAREHLRTLTAKRDELVWKADDLGIPAPLIAKAARLTRARIWQINQSAYEPR